MKGYRVVQDWEFCEEIGGEYTTIEIQIESEAEAVRSAQKWADETGHTCWVSTSLRYEKNNSVEDRGLVDGDPKPIKVVPNGQKTN
uniref:Uncharacterized protein n=1 Tax=viral metagenome TaxID=1070528 RepID=A0A6M3JCV1_9ZZZZ